MATLLSLMLIIGLVMLFQSIASANTKTIKRLIREENQRAEIDSVRELSRPFLVEAMINFDGPHRLSLNGRPLEVQFGQAFYNLTAYAETDGTSQPKQAVLTVAETRR